MDTAGRRWNNPYAVSLRGPDGRAIGGSFDSLTEFFSRTVGIWGNYSGTTDADGELSIAHNAPFTPSVVLITERNAGAGHVNGPFNVLSVDKDNVRIHFLTMTGADRASTTVLFDMLCLP